MNNLTSKVWAWLKLSQNYSTLLGIFSVLVLMICVASISWYGTQIHIQSEFRVIYSLDRRQNDQEIIRVINSAERYVYFAVYYFSKNNIADALIAAKDRGVIVRGIVDREGNVDANKAVFDKLVAAGIPVETQRHLDGIMHMKAMVTDKAYASGSYNWTEAATDSNDEILEIGTDGAVREQYLSIIKRLLVANQ
jgi:phosphatidylserine/phosphatidylglycerophosphate/cardiolipin synthase-like enzyme